MILYKGGELVHLSICSVSRYTGFFVGLGALLLIRTFWRWNRIIVDFKDRCYGLRAIYSCRVLILELYWRVDKCSIGCAMETAISYCYGDS